jgi:hypothetical protein
MDHFSVLSSLSYSYTILHYGTAQHILLNNRNSSVHELHKNTTAILLRCSSEQWRRKMRRAELQAAKMNRGKSLAPRSLTARRESRQERDAVALESGEGRCRRAPRPARDRARALLARAASACSAAARSARPLARAAQVPRAAARPWGFLRMEWRDLGVQERNGEI